MKILLFGEYSNVHWTLAEGLRARGHKVTVISDGDVWKDYPRDINLKRGGLDKWHTLIYILRLLRVLHRCKGYDIVQLINPVFVDLRAERIPPFYRYLRRHNKKIILGAFGIDHYWVKTGLDCTTFRYSDFNIGSTLRHNADNDTYIADWLQGPKGTLNQLIARDCDAIVTGLYEYDRCYRPVFPKKTHFIPFPIDIEALTPTNTLQETHLSKIRFFIGIQRSRSAYKGTDIMLQALERLLAANPDKMEIVRVENVPYAEYQRLMDSSHVLLDQLYSYTPAMNALLAMAKGLIVVGGGEEEQYEIIHEQELRPIINVQPDIDDVCHQIQTRLLDHPESIHQLQLDSITYVRRHHALEHIAQQYEQLYSQQ